MREVLCRFPYPFAAIILNPLSEIIDPFASSDVSSGCYDFHAKDSHSLNEVVSVAQIEERGLESVEGEIRGSVNI